ncbi:MAG: CRISPR-associated protein Cas5 [Gemmatimonadetes bacterium]|nr:CRISPR-associated protein Cas5 [Gemmatimonadota bacterium]MYG23680.1 CRISPR-associated protein Cas5 [Gemmatimonadota bacterium]MYJ39497.1 CRISPR-associated protein Cas5 [Gemmatimonadota bacterium]
MRKRFSISSVDAVSKKRAKDSSRFDRASATESPWLATSTSGHRATYPFPSRSTIAVSCLVILCLRHPPLHLPPEA